MSFLAVVLSAGCDDSRKGAEANNQTPPPRPVRLERVKDATGVVSHRFSGRVEAVQTVDLSFQVGGKIIEMPIREGGVLKEGGLIAKLDPTDYERAVREAEVNLELTQKEYDRAATLRKRGVVAAKTLDERKATMELNRVALDKARQNLAYTTLEAPFDALVANRLVDNFTNVAAGTEVVRIQDVSEIQISVDVPESLLARVERADVESITAQFEGISDQRFSLEYREYESEPDPVTQTYKVTLAMNRVAGMRVLPGMTAQVAVELSPPGGAPTAEVLVPVSAVAVDEDKDFYVWVFDDEIRTVKKRPVTVGPIGDRTVPVRSGLKAGERIVTAGVSHLEDGMPVRPAEIE